MQLDSQYPDASPGFRSPSGFYKAASPLECFHCGHSTHWFHLGNLLFFCSDQCYDSYLAGAKGTLFRLPGMHSEMAESKQHS